MENIGAAEARVTGSQGQITDLESQIAGLATRGESANVKSEIADLMGQLEGARSSLKSDFSLLDRAVSENAGKELSGDKQDKAEKLFAKLGGTAFEYKATSKSQTAELTTPKGASLPEKKEEAATAANNNQFSFLDDVNERGLGITRDSKKK